jgi:hypothetical protein
VSTLNVNRVVDSSGGVLAPISSVMRNRIINGQMTIDQRNAGASVTQTTTYPYTVDRWQIGGTVTSKFTAQQNAGSVTPPVGFLNYLGITSSSAYSVPAGDIYLLQQSLEGFNTSDLGWGTANAATVTLSFWVRSSLTGTFGGAINNYANTRSYPFSYTISAANTWEQKSVTIAGDTSGTWVGNSSAGSITLRFGLGVGSTFSATAGAWATGAFYAPTGATSVVGTNGATFYITGVQLERGTQATSFEYRQYGTELALCQRYLPVTAAGDVYSGMAIGTTGTYIAVPFKVTARVAPTGISVLTNGALWYGAASYAGAASVAYITSGVNSAMIAPQLASGLTAGGAVNYQAGNILFTGCEL